MALAARLQLADDIDYRDAIAHLPAGGILTFHYVPWAKYEKLLNDLGTRYFPTYANLGVPEIWQYDEQAFHFYHLAETGYVEATASHAFPFLTSEVLAQFLERSLTQGQSATLRAFRAWVKTQTTTTT